MKLTITIEEDKESEVRVDRPGGISVMPAEERPTDLATSAGGPPEWLLVGAREERPQTQAMPTEGAATCSTPVRSDQHQRPRLRPQLAFSEEGGVPPVVRSGRRLRRVWKTRLLASTRRAGSDLAGLLQCAREDSNLRPAD